MDFMKEGIALGIDAIVFGVCLKMYMRSKQCVIAVQEMPVYDINTDLVELVKSQPSEKLPYGGVCGTVKAIGSPIHSLNNPDVTGVVQRLKIMEHFMSRSTYGFWSEQERVIQEIYNHVPFVICSRTQQIEILDPLTTDILDMDTISNKFEMSKPNFIDDIWGFFVGIRPRGLQSREDLLREGSLVMGVGEITLSKLDESLQLQSPSDGSPYIISSLPVSSLVRQLEREKQRFKWLVGLSAAVGIGIISFAAFRWWKLRSRRLHEEEQRQQMDETRKRRRQQARGEDLPQSQLCVVCCDLPREVIILPCGHVCLCEDCSEEISDYCPVCRTPVESKAAAYLS